MPTKNYKLGDIRASLWNGRANAAAHQALVNAANHLARGGHLALSKQALQLALMLNDRERLLAESGDDAKSAGDGR